MSAIPASYIRKIVHIDMDAFYASVEQRDRPELRGKPLAVGGSRERGVVAAASYEARKYGVHSALASAIAFRRCPDLIFVKPRFEHYKAISQQLRELFLEYTSLVEPLSLDEAYLDVTENKRGLPTATKIAREIRQRIWEEVGLRASAGISINKFLAKVASDINKPNGQKTIMPDQALEFLETLPVEDFYGVGAKTAERMRELHIYTGADLKARSRPELVREFGKSGSHYYHIVRGMQRSAVQPNRIRKSVGAERTMAQNLEGQAAVRQALLDIIPDLLERIRKSGARGKTLTLKIKYADFETITRSKSLPNYTEETAWIQNVLLELLAGEVLLKPVRLVGASLSNLEQAQTTDASGQLTLRF